MINRRGPDWWANAIRRSATVLVIEIGGKLAGYATIGRNRAPNSPSRARYTSFTSAPNIQGIGLGSRLFAAARKKLADPACAGWWSGRWRRMAALCPSTKARAAATSPKASEVFDQKALKKVAYVWD